MCYWQCNGKTLRMWENPVDHWYMQAPIRLLGSWHPSLWLCPSKCRFFLFLLTSTTYRKHAFFLVVFNLWTISLRRFRHSKVSLLQEMSQCCGTVVGPGRRSALWRCAKAWNAMNAWQLDNLTSGLSSSGILGMTWPQQMAENWHISVVFLFPNQRRPLDFHLIDPPFCPWIFCHDNFRTELCTLHWPWNVQSWKFHEFQMVWSSTWKLQAIWALTRRVWNLPSHKTLKRTLCDWKWDGIMNAALFILNLSASCSPCTAWRFDMFLAMFCWPQVLQLWPAKQWASMQKESANSSRHESRKGPACSCESSPRML